MSRCDTLVRRRLAKRNTLSGPRRADPSMQRAAAIASAAAADGGSNRCCRALSVLVLSSLSLSSLAATSSIVRHSDGSSARSVGKRLCTSPVTRGAGCAPAVAHTILQRRRTSTCAVSHCAARQTYGEAELVDDERHAFAAHAGKGDAVLSDVDAAAPQPVGNGAQAGSVGSVEIADADPLRRCSIAGLGVGGGRGGG